jgi:TPP-dependent 2-oxoacid decarboxylase
MKCPICGCKVINNSDYSVHMNLSHRGQSYEQISSYETKDINRETGKKNNESRKTNVRSKVD